MRSYRDLLAWQHIRVLVKRVYELTRAFPREELYGITGQVRRAVVSAASNIAEGYGRGTRRDYVHFLHSARGSLYEVETQLILAQDLGYALHDGVVDTFKQLDHCSRLLNALIRSLSDGQGPKS